MRSTILSMLVATLAGPAVASPPSLPAEAWPATDATLARLISTSLATLPELAQARATASAQRERVPQAGALPDPTLQLGIQNDGFTSIEIGKMEGSFVSIAAAQTFPWPGKLRLRSRVAELAAGQSETAILRLRLSTEAEVRRAYLDLLLARDRLVLLDRLEAIWRKSAASALVLYETGRGSQSDVLRSQLELNRLRQRRWTLAAEERVRLQALNRLRRRPLDEPIAAMTRVAGLRVPRVPDDRSAVAFAQGRSPELRSARLAVRGARSSLALARKSYLPDFTLSAGVMLRGGELPPMWQLGVGGTLPVFAGSKQRRAEAESRAQLDASESGVLAIEEVLRLRVRQRRAALTAALDTIALYRGGLLTQSEATASSTLASYQVGRASFASVLEANSGFIGDQEAYLATLAAAQRLAIASVEVSLGEVAVASGAGMGAQSALPGAAAMGGGAAAPAPAAAAPAAEGSSSSMPKM